MINSWAIVCLSIFLLLYLPAELLKRLKLLVGKGGDVVDGVLVVLKHLRTKHIINVET